MDVSAIAPIAISVIALVFTWLSFRRNATQDTTASATERATMTADIRYIRQSVDDIKLENKSTQKDVAECMKRLIIVEESAKSAHKRIDEIVKG